MQRKRIEILTSGGGVRKLAGTVKHATIESGVAGIEAAPVRRPYTLSNS